MRIVVILLLVAIVVSLGSALIFIYRDENTGKTRAVKALSLRVGLSFLLFLLLMAGYRLGWISSTL